MRKLPREKRAMVIKALAEGECINACARLCGVSKVTVLRLLAVVDYNCEVSKGRGQAV